MQTVSLRDRSSSQDHPRSKDHLYRLSPQNRTKELEKEKEGFSQNKDSVGCLWDAS